MAAVPTTKMSPKGQVVIPEEIRAGFGLKAGSQFVVVSEKDTVLLKVIVPPSMKDLDHLVGEARKKARTTQNILQAVRESRSWGRTAKG